MKYYLKENYKAGEAIYKTSVDITEKDGTIKFFFEAENSKCYCPYNKYNEELFEGDVCEVFIGSDPLREIYYEIVLAPNNTLFLARVTDRGNRDYDIDHIDKKDCFVEYHAGKTEKGYFAEFKFKLQDIRTGDGEIIFNAFRIDTDGEYPEKHLFALNPSLRDTFHYTPAMVKLKDYLK